MPQSKVSDQRYEGAKRRFAAAPAALFLSLLACAPEATAPAAAKPAGGPERRCGWLHNPTPGNWWLVDRDGEWILATQGDSRAEGMDDLPDMSAADWQETNGYYGYGCACMTITADPATGAVTRVMGAEPKPLEQCRADKALPRP